MNTFKWILGFAFAMIFSLAANAQNVQGVMMVVKGDVKVTGTDGKTEAAKVGKKVSAGDTILAGADSRAKIVMADKNVINVSPDSKIVIEKYENDGKDKKNVELNVVYGKVRASVEQKYDGDKSKFNVKTPSAVAGVRGTDFLTGYNAGTKTTSITTFTGSVAVGQPGPGGTIKNPVFVLAGQMTQVGFGKAPEAPKTAPKEDLKKESENSSASNAKESGDRKPASESSGSGSMVAGGDLPQGPDAGKNFNSDNGGPKTPTPPPILKTPFQGPCGGPCPPPPPPVVGSKSKVNIILNPK